MKDNLYRAWDGNRMIYFDSLEISLGREKSKGRDASPYVFFRNDTFNGEVRLGAHKVMQFVSLYDKNGKEAYVGNIYKETRPDGTELFFKIFEVKGGFAVNQFQDDFYKDAEYIVFYAGLSDMQTASWFEGTLEEIGNIYENKELLIKK